MANPKQLALLRQGVEQWNQWKENSKDTTLDSAEDDIYDADLSEANLSGMNLNGANLGAVDLSNANLVGTQLAGAILTRSELAEANFSGANLTGADLSYTNICGANLSKADFRDADLSRANLSESNLNGANLSGANLQYADLSGIDLSAVQLLGTNLYRARVTGVPTGNFFLDFFIRPKEELRRAREVGALTGRRSNSGQGIEKNALFRLQKKGNDHDIVLYARPNFNLLRLLGGSLLLVIIGIWFQQHAVDRVQMIMSWVAIIFFGLGVVVFLFQLLWPLVKRAQLLVINDEGIQYFYHALLVVNKENPMIANDVSLKWKEIGAIDWVEAKNSISFGVFATSKRLRTGWPASILIPESVLGISAAKLITLIQEQYKAQLEAYHIKDTVLRD